jgi:hypothetical protein
LVNDAWRAYQQKDRFSLEIKFESAKKLYTALAFPEDKQALADIISLEGAKSELHKDYPSAEKFYNECLQMPVLNRKKALAAQAMINVCKAEKNEGQAKHFEQLAAQLTKN